MCRQKNSILDIFQCGMYHHRNMIIRAVIEKIQHVTMTQDGEYLINPNTFKTITCLLVMFLGGIGGFLPKIIRQKGANGEGSVVSAAVNSFTGGVFLSSAMLHLLPDATSNEQLQTVMSKTFFTSDKDYPWAELFFTIGFIILLTAESLSHSYQNVCFCDDCPRSPNTSDATAGEIERLQIQTLTYNSHDYISHTSVSRTNDHLEEHNNDDEVSYDDDIECQQDSVSAGAGLKKGDFCNFQSDISYKSLTVHNDLDESCPSNVSTQVTSTHCNRLPGDLSCCGESVDDISYQEEKDSPPIMSFVIFLSLSLHSIMAGIGIGAEPGCAWDILFAILVHKSVAAFALGVEFMNHEMQHRTYIILMLLFAQMTPFGILLGWGLTTFFSGEDSALSGICIALSAGTFLYVGVMEIIPKEFKNQNHTPLKIFTLSVGFVIIAILAKYV